MLLSRPDSKDLRDFARLPPAIDHGFEPRTSNRVIELKNLKNLKWPSSFPHIIRDGKIMWKHEIKKRKLPMVHV